MKRIIFLLTLFVSLSVFSQFKSRSGGVQNLQEIDEKKLSYGFWFGYNQFSFDLDPKPITTGPTIGGTDGNYNPRIDDEAGQGFSVGLMGRMRLHRYVDLMFEPGLHFVTRTIFFTQPSLMASPENEERIVKSTYIELPMSVKLHGERYKNTRPFVKAGVAYLNNIQSGEGKSQDNLDGVFRTTTHNFSWNGELGVEIYFTRFKLTPSIKGMFFLNNELVKDNDPETPFYANAIESLKTRAFIFSLKFQ